jgi:hypothetical protein
MRCPFSDYKAPEISEGNQKYYFVQPKYFSKLLDTHASFIFGERGSGKTTILKFLEREMNQSHGERWLAFYYRFETSSMKSLYKGRLSEEDNFGAFQQTICTIFLKLICEKLIGMKKVREFEKEKEICYSVASLQFLVEPEQVDSFEKLYDLMEKIRLKTLFGIRNGISKMLIDYNSILENLINSLRQEQGLGELTFCVLLDEYENLLPIQQRVINSMVKASSDRICYKICLRPQGFWTRQTMAEREHLMEDEDYLKINYVEDIMGTEVDIQKMVRSICNKRLKLFYESEGIVFDEDDINIDNYLECQTQKEEINKIPNLKEYRERLIKIIKDKAYIVDKKKLDKLDDIQDIVDLQIISIMLEKGYEFSKIYNSVINRTNQYDNWIHNYEVNATYIIFDECKIKKQFSGLDIMLRLVNYNMRSILLILHYAFEGYDFRNLRRLKISVDKQNKAIIKVAKNSFNQIEYIPVHGAEVKNLTNALGNLFREYIVDQRAKKFETNNFAIRVSGNIKEDQEIWMTETLKDAVMWGILLETDANKTKNPSNYTYHNKDYILHPIYAVYFNISYRTKQKTYLDDDVVISMFKPLTDRQIRRLVRNDNKEIQGQMTLMNLE